jgi:hypothetical protein
VEAFEPALGFTPADAADFIAGAGALTGPAAPLTIGTAAGAATEDFATAAQGTDERVPTAAGLTTKFGTNKATLVDGDKVALLDSAAADVPKHGLLSAIATYIIGVGRTLSGAWAFDSTTRPTSAGTGTPAATSLITYNDAVDMAIRELGGWVTHRVDYFTTGMLTTIGGTASSTSSTEGADEPCWVYRPITTTDAANNYQALAGAYLQLSPGSTRSVKNWSKRSRLSFITYLPFATNGTLRYYWGPQASTWAGGSLAVRGIGFEVVANQLFAVCHNGSAKTTSAGSVTLDTNLKQVAIESDGAGGVRWWADGVEQPAMTGGPTGNSGSSQYGFCTEAINPTPAAATFCIVSNLLMASKI